MTAPWHPTWCDRSACTATADGGEHRSTTVLVTTGRGDRAPKFLLLLAAPTIGRPIRLRMVVESALLVSSVEVDVDTGQLLAAHILTLIDSTRPAE